MFTDQVSLMFVAGKGGDGVVAWRREKFVAKGGPAGGDGGNGGNIIIIADPHLLSLENFKHKKVIKAENADNGGGMGKTGKNGEDIIIKVPVGTLIKDQDGTILFDLVDANDKFTLCKGGKGGKGNINFKSPTNQAPNICTPGTLGEIKEITLELKIIADIGLIGMPNAGKSTLLSNLAKAKAKIAAYPFTTLSPNLGVIVFDDFTKAKIADIPGIIENAHLNKGLGLTFLKHIERTSLLVFVIDIADTEDPYENFCMLKKEIASYNSEILNKPYIIAFNKIDLIEEKKISQIKEKFSKEAIIIEISALEKKGFDKLRILLQEMLPQTVISS